jgi:hypothetical protein
MRLMGLCSWQAVQMVQCVCGAHTCCQVWLAIGKMLVQMCSIHAFLLTKIHVVTKMSGTHNISSILIFNMRLQGVSAWLRHCKQ